MIRFTPLIVACLAASPALAQSGPAGPAMPSAEEVADKDMVTIAAGAAYRPDYEGSDDYHFIPAAAIRGKVHGIAFTTRATYLYVDVIKDGPKFGFDFGPIVGARSNKRRHIHGARARPVLRTILPRGASLVAERQVLRPATRRT